VIEGGVYRRIKLRAKDAQAPRGRSEKNPRGEQYGVLLKCAAQLNYLQLNYLMPLLPAPDAPGVPVRVPMLSPVGVALGRVVLDAPVLAVSLGRVVAEPLGVDCVPVVVFCDSVVLLLVRSEAVRALEVSALFVAAVPRLSPLGVFWPVEFVPFLSHANPASPASPAAVASESIQVNLREVMSSSIAIDA
jgi:hypothetical protein